MTAKYTPSPLPVKLDLLNPDTAGQLGRKGNPRVSPQEHPRNSRDVKVHEQLNRDFHDLLRSDLSDFLQDSADRSFEAWLRRFHSEYDDEWFSKNRGRLVGPFRAIWDEHFGVSGGEASLIDL